MWLIVNAASEISKPAITDKNRKRPFRHLYPACVGMTKRAFLNGFFLRRCLRQNLRHEIQAYVQRAAAVGQIAEGDAVHAGLRYALQAVEADAARCFAIDGAGVGGLRVAAVCRFFQGFVVHVIQQNPFRARCDGFVQLCQRVHFDFHAGQRSDCLLRLPHGLGDAAAIGEVVVFDEYGVVQTHAVVHAAACPDGVFLQDAQQGDGFAAAHDVCAVFGDFGDGTRGGGGDATQVREVVERGAFGGEQGAGVAFDGGKRLTCADGLPVLDFGLEADGRIHRLKGEARQVHACDDAVFAADEEEFGGFVGRDDGGGCNVAAPAQIFAQGLFHHGAQQGVGQGEEGVFKRHGVSFVEKY